MILLLIVWVVCGIFNAISYLYQCVKDGEILDTFVGIKSKDELKKRLGL